jgi:hypothetical protein
MYLTTNVNDSHRRLVEFGPDGLHSQGLPAYFFSAFYAFTNVVDFTGKKILEIGGSSLSQDFVFNVLGADAWTSIDIINHEAGQYQRDSHPRHYEELGIEPLANMTDHQSKKYEIYNGAIEKVDYTKTRLL